MKSEGFLIVSNNSNITKHYTSGYTLQYNLADIFIYDFGDDLGLDNRETI